MPEETKTTLTISEHEATALELLGTLPTLLVFNWLEENYGTETAAKTIGAFACVVARVKRLEFKK